MKKRSRTKLEEEERGGEEGSEGGGRRRRTSPCFHVLSLQEDCPTFAFLGMHRSTLHRAAPARVTAVLGITPKADGEAHMGKGRQGSKERRKVSVIRAP